MPLWIHLIVTGRYGRLALPLALKVCTYVCTDATVISCISIGTHKRRYCMISMRFVLYVLEYARVL